MALTEKELRFINDLIIKIYTVDNVKVLREQVLLMMELLIPSVGCSFFLKDLSGKHMIADPVGIGFSDEIFTSYINEYADKDFFKYVLSFTDSRVYRRSDFLSDQELEANTYYQEAWKPMNLYYLLSAGLCYKENFLGLIAFYREKESGDFTEEEMFILDLIKDHLNIRLFNVYGKIGSAITGGSFDDDDKFTTFAGTYDLTKKETEILKLWYRGMTDQEMAEILLITKNTLKKHITNMYRKMNINSKIELLKLMK